MKNNQNACSDLEAATEHWSEFSRIFQLFNLTKTKNPSDTAEQPHGCLSKFKKLIKTLRESVFLRIFKVFQLTKSNTKQKALLLLYIAAAIFDPLFFYIPMINEDAKCVQSDRKLGVIAISLRSLVDVLHFMLWWFYYQKKWKAGGSKFSATAAASSAPGEENKQDSSALSTVEQKEENPPGKPHSLSPRNPKAAGQLIQILCIIPLPQAATLAILIIKGSPRSEQAVTLLKFSVLGQFILRAFRVFPSFHEATTNSFTLLKSRFWIGAGFNLLLFVISSHVLGAFWYLLSVGRTMDCWESACRSQDGCNINSLYCGGPTDNKSYLDDYCPVRQANNSSAFNFGIYLSALESNIVASTRFPLKLGYCFWWGLRNLSSLGQNLITSAYEWEICFSICISILGLILFSLFIGNMQAYFQDKTNEDLRRMKGKMDKVMKKHGELSKWKFFKLLPQKLKQHIESCVEDKWLDTPAIDLQTMLDHFPKDIGRQIKLNILWELQRKVKLFQALNKRSPSFMYNNIKLKVFEEGTVVFRKGCRIDRLVFILNGKVKRQSGEDVRLAEELREWDFCGEELLKGIISLEPKSQSSINHPQSTTDVETSTKVEAFILDANDLHSLINRSKDTTDDIHRCIVASMIQRLARIRVLTKQAMKFSEISSSEGLTESSTMGSGTEAILAGFLLKQRETKTEILPQKSVPEVM